MIVALAALALALLVALLVAPGAGFGRPKPSGPPRSDAGASPATLSTSERVEADTAAERSSSSVLEGSRSALATSTATVVADVPPGVVIVTDPDGRELDREDGELVITASGGAEHHGRVVPFRGGSFALGELPIGTVRIARASGISDGERRPIHVDRNELELRPGEPLIVRGRYVRDSTLRVVDARTGVPLERVSVMPKLPEHAGPEQLHPGPHYRSSFAITDASSPVRLPRVDGVRSYWVTARGHAWGFVQVDHDSGGERELPLAAAGRLEVRVVGHDPSVMVRLRVRTETRGKTELAGECALNEGGWQAFSGLREGAYVVSAEVGAAEATTLVLGRAEANVRGGETTTALVEITGAPVPAPVLVRGTLTLPSEHAALPVALRIRRADGITFRQGDAKRIRRDAMSGGPESALLGWTADRLTPGRYVLTVEPVEYGVLVDVPLAPLENVLVAVPPLHPVALHAIDARTRQPIDGAETSWSREPPEGGGPAEWSEPVSAAAGVMSLVLPTGPVSFRARSSTHAEALLSARVSAGANVFTLELEPRFPREIVLLHGTTRIPWSHGSSCTFRGVGASDAHACQPAGSGEMRAYFPQPGLYEIAVGPLAGFRQPEPLVVAVEAGESEPIVVPLAR